MPIHELFSRPFVFLDGGMGTMLQRHGLPAGEHPERFNLTAPEIVASVHRAYLEAGSDIVYSNTFGASARKLSGSGLTPADVIPAAIHLAKDVASEFNACVALDIGPIGELMEPNGTLSFDEAYELFREQILLGAEAGADLVVIETMTDLAEMRAAVLAAKENCSLPVFATMSFEEGGRTFTGTSAVSMAEVLTGLGVDALGVNCSLGPKQLLPIIRAIGEVTHLPLIVKANAGLPDAKPATICCAPRTLPSRWPCLPPKACSFWAAAVARIPILSAPSRPLSVTKPAQNAPLRPLAVCAAAPGPLPSTASA